MDKDPFETFFKLSCSGVRNEKRILSTYGGRYLTYKGYPLYSAYPTRLAECGLYHTGITDEVKCFECEFTYSGWRPAEIPFEVHFRLSPNCNFLLRVYFNIRLRQNFTRSEISNIISIFRPFGVSARLSESGSASFSHTYQSSGETNMTASQAFVPEISQPVEDNETATSDQAIHSPEMQQTAKDDDNGADLAALNNQNTSNVPTRRSVGNTLAKNAKCNKCWEADSTILFIPCRHLISCKRCAARLEYCFLCKEVISETIEIKRG